MSVVTIDIRSLNNIAVTTDGRWKSFGNMEDAEQYMRKKINRIKRSVAFNPDHPDHALTERAKDKTDDNAR